ncbi:Protein kinase domain [Trypanosoma melophagium]|uniref:Protein kinase domain n=1 Tax=Trypanosoma melophagium TaxID=715481 RepID=UPI00351A8294|nr:Protein kinase domain [Trypanosoma melophagium]
MIRKKVLGVGVTSATMLVEDTENGGVLRVLKRINVSTWNTKDVTEAHEMYKLLSHLNIRCMVDLSTVLLQNSFLSLVTSYNTGGNMEEYLEEKITTPLEESTVVRWLLIMARVVEHVQKQSKICFYGLDLRHIFLSDNARDISVGLPIPRVSYFRRLSDRESNKVSLELEYPPEVTREQQYHMGASDVWHLGLIGMKLLTANSSFTNRSREIRKSITAMMDANIEKRPSVHEVVRMLAQLIGEGNEELPQQRQDPHHSFSSTQFVSPISLETITRTPIAGTDDSNSDERNRPGEQGETQGNVGVLRSARHRLPQSWHRRAMEQFEELQRLNASPLRGKSRGTSPSAGIRLGSTSAEGRSSQLYNRHTTSTSLQQASERTSSISSPVGGRGFDRRRRFRYSTNSNTNTNTNTTTNNNNSSVGGNIVSSAATSMAQQILNQEMEQQRRREMLRHDYDEKRWKQMEQERMAQDAHRQHMDKLKNIRSKRGEETKSDIRKYIKQWKEQRKSSTDEKVIVSEQNGISVFVPKAVPVQKLSATLSSSSQPPTTTPTTPTTPRKRQFQFQFQQQQQQSQKQTVVTPKNNKNNNNNNNNSNNSKYNKDKNSNPVEPEKCVNTNTDTLGIIGPTRTGALTPPPLRPLTAPPRTQTPPPFTPKRYASVFIEQGVSPDVPSTRARLAETVPAPGIRCPASNATPKMFSVHSNSNKVSMNNGVTFDIPQTLAMTPNSSDMSISRVPEVEQNKGKASTSGKHGDVILLSTLEIAKSSLHNSLMKLLANRKLYLETMDVVSAFVLLSEAERHQPQFNVVFMRTLREVIGNEQLFAAAGPMCAQLVALQGLSQVA